MPAGLGRGHAPTKRDVTVALLAALMVLATRGFLLDHPRDMYFDEVYHARTAFELLAQREPYEWTHPHLAKEIMALGILAFGADRVAGNEAAPDSVTAFAVTNEGVRLWGLADGRVVMHVPDERAFGTPDLGALFAQPGQGFGRSTSPFDGPVRHLATDGPTAYVVTDRSLWVLSIESLSPQGPSREIPGGRPTSLAVLRDRLIVGTARDLQIFSSGGGPPTLMPIPVAALTAKPDSNDVFVADPTGAIHVVDVATGRETGAPIVGGPPVSAIAYARGADRIFGARAGQAAIEW